VIAFPTPERLAALVSSVTETMCGLSFGLVATPGEGDSWPVAALSIDGPTPIVVALSSSHESCSTMGSKMFGCAPTDVDAGMAEDVLRELVNMTAGQIKRALSIDQALGLPKILTKTDLMKSFDQPRALNAPLAAGSVTLSLWVGPKV
jgi:hypothetical protein